MKKHFLILMLMALLPMAGFALTLDVSKFKANNIDYGTTSLPAVTLVDGSGYTSGVDFTVVGDRFYTSNTGAGETLVGASGANLKVANNGQYFIKVEGLGTYDGQTVYVDFWIKGIPVTIDFGDVTKEFGQADADHPITYALTKKTEDWTPTEAELKDLGLTVSREKNENAGTYAYSFEWTNKNYTVTRATGDESVYTITAKNIAATATITATQGNVVYTGKDIFGVYTVLDKEGGNVLTAGTPVLYASYTEYNTDHPSATVTEADFATLTYAEKVKSSTGDYWVDPAHNVGTYNPTIHFVNNYSGTKAVSAGDAFKVTPAPIVVGVEDLEAIYDGTTNFKNRTAAAAGKFTYSGIVGDDVASAATIKANFNAPTSVQAKKDAIDAGVYELVISEGNTGSETNYAFAEYMPGKLTVKQAPLAIKAANASKSIGEADPTFEIVPVTGLTITGVTFTRVSGETEGDYEITPNVDNIVITTGSGKSLKTVTANYAPTVGTPKGKLTIGKTKIYVTIKDSEKFYGANDPDFEYTVTGLKGEDKLAAFEITRTAGEHPDAYAMTATVANPDAAKYSEVVVANGIFTIKKAQLEFTMGAMSVKVDPTDAEKTAALNKSLVKVKGINNSDKADDLFTLSYASGVVFTNNYTYPTGVTATLDNSSTTGAKKLLTEGTTSYYADDLYVIITGKGADGKVTSTGSEISGKLIVGEGSGSGTELKLDDDATAANKIAEKAGETFNNVAIKFAARNAHRGYSATATETYPWKAEKWTTMVLPFDITVAELSKALGYAIVNVINPEKTVVSGAGSEFWGKVTMKGGNGNDTKLAANKPFMLKIDGDLEEKYYNFGKQTIVAPSDLTVDAGKGVKFTGTYAAKKVTNADNAAIWFMNGNEDGWQYIGASSTSSSWTIAPFEAYIDMSSVPAGARSITFNFEDIDGTVTAIKSINTENLNKNMSREGWYNLNGVKLQGAPTQKGIYIQNGKKVVVK